MIAPARGDEAVLLATAAMGTRFELVLRGAGREHARLRAIGEEAVREIELWHQRLSRFEPASIVARVNRERRVRMDGETFGLFALAEEVRRDTGGAFDIAVGGAMERLGLHPSTGLPDGTHGAGGGSAIVLDAAECTVRLVDPAAAVDLGAIAKGFALDRAAEILRGGGVTDALIHGGTSSVIAIGSAVEGGGGWTVEVRPAGSEHAAGAWTVALRDEALGVSAPRGRWVGHGPDRITHIVDPETGRPPVSVNRGAGGNGAVAAAAVTGPSAAVCDAWSTALVVLRGREGGERSREVNPPRAYRFHVHGSADSSLHPTLPDHC